MPGRFQFGGGRRLFFAGAYLVWGRLFSGWEAGFSVSGGWSLDTGRGGFIFAA